MKVEYVDLFENIEQLPQEAKDIVNFYSNEDADFTTLVNMESDLLAVGYKFNWGLDAIPFNLRKI